MKTIDEIINELAILKSDTTTYRYKYYLSDGKGNILLDESMSDEPNTRERFVKFKNDNPDFYVDYSGKFSLREVYRRGTEEIVGYVSEEKIHNTNNLDIAKALHMETYKLVLKELDVKDLESFNYYILENDKSYDFDNSNISKVISKIRYLDSVLSDYSSDEDFRKYLNKIIK